MAEEKTTKPNPAGKPEEDKATNTERTGKTEKPKAEFDWADLPEEETVKQGYKFGSRVDVEKEIPQVIRDKAEALLTAWRDQEPGKHGKRPPIWKRQPCGTEERAKEFIRLIKRYGTYRKQGQISVRAVPDATDSTKVRYNVKDKEKKEANRLPGSETKTGAPKVEAPKTEAPKTEAPKVTDPTPTTRTPVPAPKPAGMRQVPGKPRA